MLGALVLGALLGSSMGGAGSAYEKYVAFALEEIPKQCGALLETKKIDWKRAEELPANFPQNEVPYKAAAPAAPKR